MATLSTFRPCTYIGEADFEAIAHLINTCRAADDIDYRISVTDVREDFGRPRVTFCYSRIDAERNERLSIKEGYVCLLGTRRGYRHQRLARTLLISGLQRLQSIGMETVTIGVDSQNPIIAIRIPIPMAMKPTPTLMARSIRPLLPQSVDCGQ